MVKKYLLSLSKRGGVVNKTVANATAKALMNKYPHVVDQGDFCSSRLLKKPIFPNEFCQAEESIVKGGHA